MSTRLSVKEALEDWKQRRDDVYAKGMENQGDQRLALAMTIGAVTALERLLENTT